MSRDRRLSQKQQSRHDRLVKRYRGLGVSADSASILGRGVIEKRGGYGLFRACGVPVADCELEERAFMALKAKDGPWRVYANPMRADMVFVGQDKGVDPYSSVTSMAGEPLYPAVPQSAFCYPIGLPPTLAARLVGRLNGDLAAGYEENESRRIWLNLQN